MSEHYKKHESTAEHHVSNHELKEHQKRAETHHNAAAEKAHSDHHEKQRLLQEVEKLATSKEDHAQVQEKPRHQEDMIHTKADKAHAFNSVMHHTRQHMSKPERTFSKFIHKPAVEKTSEIVGKTIARPSGMVGASVGAFIGLLSIYSVAKFAGFALSGSEMPLLLAGGFAIGLFAEWAYKSIRILVSPKKS